MDDMIAGDAERVARRVVLQHVVFLFSSTVNVRKAS